MGHLMRLRGVNISQSTRANYRNRWVTDPASKARILYIKGSRNRTMATWLTQLGRQYDGAAHHNPLTKAFAVPKEIAYASVMESLVRNHQCISLLTDNMSGRGDLCSSHFNPRGFVRWVMMENLGTICTTGPIQSTVTNADIQGWFFTPRFDKARDIVKLAREWLIEEVDNANKAGTLQERYEESRAIRATKASALSRTLTDW